jgi:hypothetical protein
MTDKLIAKRLKTSLDELRMQTMGTQILFGFQLQSLFQPGFDRDGIAERAADAGSLAAILCSFAVLIIAPAQHRLVESCAASRGLLQLSSRCAEVALATMAVALGCISFSITTHLGIAHGGLITAFVSGVAILMWFGSGALLKRKNNTNLPEHETVDLHTKIDQMLTEARVILPGVQAMVGFQLIVVMTDAFGRLPQGLQTLHMAGLALTATSTALLLTPAAIHRIAFAGEDDPRFHTIGSRLVSAALIPLALGISAEICIATWKLYESPLASSCAGLLALMALLVAWYGLPFWLHAYEIKRAA